MLPQLNKKKSIDIVQSRNSQPRLEGSSNEYKEYRSNIKSISAKKVRTGGGFMKSSLIEQAHLKQSIPSQKIAQHDNLHKFAKVRRAQDLSAQIKLIEKKIKACQKKLQEDRKRERQIAEQQQNNNNNRPDYNFQKVVKRQLQMQGYKFNNQQNQQTFDYLTNPKLQPGEQEQAEPVIEKKVIKQITPYNIEAGIEKMEKFYQNSLKKKFERREMFPHQACKRKTPKLYITQKTNALSKYGRAQNQQQHLFRVLTKETTPQQIYPTIPNFAIVKDNLSKNIVAYLGDYKPFLQKTKQVDGLGTSADIKQKTQQNDSQKQEIIGNKTRHFKQSLRINTKTKTNQKQKTQA